ncbi:Efflux pump [Lachnellula occidentalis]|uniref:Efflux pump n=1 Tax=Lachnellula occidentalis TaxID=215460 RepID=A0A8H8U3D2_9HELO|nr:Efflux pump [Lachnellula occidentalis]
MADFSPDDRVIDLDAAISLISKNSLDTDPTTTPSSPSPESGWTDKQSNLLPHKKLLIVFPVIAIVQFTSYLDQSTISTAVPTIGAELQLGGNVSWVPTSFLIASTCTQLVNGRLSDIFGRKELLLCALGLLALGNLFAGFAQNGATLYAFRALSGLGGGAINALVMIIISDITTLQQRGKYNGYIGAAVAFGNAIGPWMGGAFTSRFGWRWAIWYNVPWIAIVIALAFLVLPKSQTTGNVGSKLHLVDWLGVAVSVAMVLMLLIPLSQGGAALPWDSPLVIGMLVTGVLLMGVFLLIEWKFAKLPVVPLHLFTISRSANIILLQSALFGFVFWGNLYYIPFYMQNVLGYTPVISGALIIPLVSCQGIGSIIAGRLISSSGRYNPVIRTAQLLWLIGACLQITYTRHTPGWQIITFGLLQGLGVGGAFQPSLVALLAHSNKADRAVANCLRNFIRTLGGAVGLTVSGTMLNNGLRARLAGMLPDATIALLTASTSEVSDVHLSPVEREGVLDAYMNGIHIIFTTYAFIMAVSFLLAWLVVDDGLAERDAPERVKMGRMDVA